MDDADFYDLRVVSTLGLTDEDVAALGQVEGVREVQPATSADLLVEADGDTIVSRAFTACPRRTTTRSTVCALWMAACRKPPA